MPGAAAYIATTNNWKQQVVVAVPQAFEKGSDSNAEQGRIPELEWMVS